MATKMEVEAAAAAAAVVASVGSGACSGGGSGSGSATKRKLAAVDAPAGLVVQFGHGVFMRGHIDWMLQRSRDAGLWAGKVVGVKLTSRGGIGPLGAAPAYPLAVRGARGGARIDEASEVDIVERWLNPHDNDAKGGGGGLAALLATATAPHVAAVVSNSTEAGIAYTAAPSPFDRRGVAKRCPESFPAKLTLWLATRFGAGAGGAGAGGAKLTILPLELVEDAAAKLRGIVLRHANDWRLDDHAALHAGALAASSTFGYDTAGGATAFEAWLAEHVEFRSTLVDRIVTKPDDADDPRLVVVEPYHLLVVEEPPAAAAAAAHAATATATATASGGELERQLRLKAAGLNVVYARDGDLARWRTRKVRLLNGAHHALVFLGLRLGLGNVRECMAHAALGSFVRHVLAREVAPALDGADLAARAAAEQAEVDGYVATVLERFANPFLDHRLASIALNSAAKARVRLLPAIGDYQARAHAQQEASSSSVEGGAGRSEQGASVARGRGAALPPGLVLALAAFFAYDGPPLAGCDAEPTRAEACAEVAGLNEALERATAALRDDTEAAIRAVVDGAMWI